MPPGPFRRILSYLLSQEPRGLSCCLVIQRYSRFGLAVRRLAKPDDLGAQKYGFALPIEARWLRELSSIK
ncbi:hypothetical protein ACVW0I_000017 [Bradyrhizobium sp. LM6.11]